MIKMDRIKKALSFFDQLSPKDQGELQRFDLSRLSRRAYKEFWGDMRAQMIPQRLGGSQMLSVLPPSFFSTPDWTTFAAEIKGIQEVLRWPLYHYKVYSAAGYTSRQFFDETEGSATQNRGDTNMKSIGQLPGNEMQVVVGVHVMPIPALADVTGAATTLPVALRDWYTILGLNCWMEMVVSDKEYIVCGPLWMFPQTWGMWSSQSAIAAGALNAVVPVVHGDPSNRSAFHMDPPIGILPVRPFKIVLRWGVAQTAITAGKLGVILNGWKIRAVL